MEKDKEGKVKNQRHFIDDWLSDESFKDCLKKNLKDTTKARNVVCLKSLELSSSGRSALTAYVKGAKHNEALKKVKSFWGKQVSALSKDSIVATSQKTLDSCVIKSEVTKAETI